MELQRCLQVLDGVKLLIAPPTKRLGKSFLPMLMANRSERRLPNLPLPLGLASPLQRLGEDARKSIKALQPLLPVHALGRIYGRNRFNSFNNWDGLHCGLGPYRGAGYVDQVQYSCLTVTRPGWF